MMSSYKGKPLGTIGHIGAFSFHETKNYTSAGEGGLLIINDEKFVERAEIIREKGTNRSQFFRGRVDKYTWVDIGSSYLMSDLQAAYLWGQLEKVDEINQNRLSSWGTYYNRFQNLEKSGVIELPVIPIDCKHNAHMFYIKVKDLNERTRLLEHLTNNSIHAVFHYVPLHSSIAGRIFGVFHGDDKFTTHESDRLIRLPLYLNIGKSNIERVIDSSITFFEKSFKKI
jgi:dTDP-4-amino-4,6-dideoxygalactose transaminase